MEEVSLAYCSKCRLLWVFEQEHPACPRCRRSHTIPEKPIQIAAKTVKVKEVVLRGQDSIFTDGRQLLSMEKLLLGLQCPHGMLIDHLCPTCYPEGHAVFDYVPPQPATK